MVAALQQDAGAADSGGHLVVVVRVADEQGAVPGDALALDEIPGQRRFGEGVVVRQAQLFLEPVPHVPEGGHLNEELIQAGGGQEHLPVALPLQPIEKGNDTGAQDGVPIEPVVPDDELVGHALVWLVLGAEAVAHLLVIGFDGEAEDRPIGVHIRERGDAPLREHGVGDGLADQGVVQYGAVPVPDDQFRLHKPLPVDSGVKYTRPRALLQEQAFIHILFTERRPRLSCQGLEGGVYYYRNNMG